MEKSFAREYFLWLFKLITILVILIIGIPLLLGGMVAAIVSASKVADGVEIKDGKKSVAVVELEGVIMGSKDVLEKLHKQVEDDKIQGIVLRIDSPGGAVGPSQEIYSAVKRLKEKKPIVVSMGGVAASGGLYAAMGASKVLCQPGTLTGSIGVILQVPNFTKIADTVGFQMVTIKSGELKDAGNSFRPMTDGERDYLQGTIGDAHLEFMRAVSEGRGIDLETVKTFADGRVILGSHAKELKLVDDFGDVYDAARLVFELSGAPLGKDETPTLVYSSDKFDKVLEKVLDGVTNIPRLLQPGFRLQYLLTQ